MSELYNRVRPKNFKGLIGQPDAVAILDRLLKTDKFPHALLLSGPSGCGKTTIARILKAKLNCSDLDYQELNTSDFRGIEMVRELRMRIGLSPMGGDTRVVLLDECFPGETIVNTPFGDLRIDSLSAGDYIYSVERMTKVKQVFVNTVPLNRVVQLTLTDGRVLFTTKEHEFLTSEGWVQAQHLADGYCIFGAGFYTMGQGGPYAADVPIMQEGIQTEVPQPSEVLLQELRSEATADGDGQRIVGDSGMLVLQDGVRGTSIVAQEILPHILRQEGGHGSAGVSEAGVQSGESGQDIEGSGRQTETVGVGEDEEQKPNEQSGFGGEDGSYEGAERHAARLAGDAGWQRAIDARANDVAPSAGTGMGNGGVNTDRAQDTLPQLLQSRHSQNSNQVGCRGRWEEPSVEKEYIARRKEGLGASPIGVARVEIYEQGRNDSAFVGVIGDQEREQGFVRFYDLEIEGHPSYFVDGLPVHNCHKLTNDAQNAMLKLLEEPPSHCYFILGTTEPSKLIKAILTRCTEVRVELLKDPAMKELLARTLMIELGKAQPAEWEEVVDRIVEVAEGSPRRALVLLEQTLALNTTEERLQQILKGDAKAQAHEICRALFGFKKWADVKTLVAACEEEPETVRRIMLGYASKVLLGGGKNSGKAAQIIQECMANWYDCGKAGLVLSCYNICGG